MTSQQIITFLSVAKNLSYRKASEELFITQPAITKHINTLEEELGFKLFDRSKKVVSLTPYGELFFDFAEKTSTEYDHTLMTMRNLNESRSLRIGCEIGLHYTPLTDSIAQFIREYPSTNISFEFCDNYDLRQLVSSQYYDLYVTHYEIYVDDPFTGEYMFIENKRYGIYAKNGYMDITEPPKDLSAYDGCTFLDPYCGNLAKDFRHRSLSETDRMELVHNMGLYPGKMQHSPNWQTIMGMVDLGAGVTLMAENDALANDKEHIWSPTSKTSPVMAFWFKKTGSQALDLFLDILNEHVQEKPSDI